MVRWGMLGVALGLLAISADASADTKTLARAGSWEAFGGTTTGGRGVCGISAEPAGRYLGLKLFAGGQTFTIQMGTSAWKLDKGRKVELTLRFDNNPTWRATGTAFLFDDGDAGLQFDVNRAEIDTFAREFRDSSTLRIVFQDNVLPQWIMGLEGTMAVNSAFQSCMKSLK
jgi:hypothetical protein